MNENLPRIYLARHGKTTWSRAGRHTGLTDLPLTAQGEDNARRLGRRLAALSFATVFTSPLRRAERTCELAGFAGVAQPDRDLLEWNYGQYEGLTTRQIRSRNPGWQLFRNGCPGGESPRQVAARANRVVERLRATRGNVLIFSSGHFLRMLAIRWIELAPVTGRLFLLKTASLSVLGYENDRSQRVIHLWNDISHLSGKFLRT